jgi:hypothetical protein
MGGGRSGSRVSRFSLSVKNLLTAEDNSWSFGSSLAGDELSRWKWRSLRDLFLVHFHSVLATQALTYKPDTEV